MIRYKRRLRMKNLEIFMLFKDSISMGYLIIEDLRRHLNEYEKQLLPFRIMTDDELAAYKNVFKIYVLSDEELSEEDADVFREFAMDLVDEKDYCLHIAEWFVNEKFFFDAPLDLEVEDYQKMLEIVGSPYDISELNLEKLMYLSQE